MLFVVLLLIVAAAGVLAGAVVTGNPHWAWISVGLSVLATMLLILASARRGRRLRAASTGAGETAEPASASEERQPSELSESDTRQEHGGQREFDGREESPVSAEHDAVRGAAEPDGAAGDEPAEEDTDAADALVVSELEVAVVVIDERPRYHLEDCDWASRHTTIPLPVWEARDLGFTPCALCEPDTTLAARQRATH
ncbi:hypothetical protein DFQ14_107152 [Halopolyspora algeriensis]|uniref:Uncharacterized protein n=1 Tax=Halopolyspora algeriensis TaxID=1500506 RepID=A0A368VUZ4_9ACTN|nr:hypothetical protein [Halopolyspora algeriensis]RCW43263.1 hypothetical protein DFQ14_107152 [Halopolyspora algeriensis]TQM56322.1 hypothetical protein FHU43_1116 [Halopolyspora algeriensis]